MAREATGLTEKQFEGQIRELAKIFGWLYYHTWRSTHSPAGFPDCVMVRGKRLVIAELKSEKGIVSEKQQEWLDALRQVPAVEVFLWRPDDLEEIVEALK